MDALKDLLDGLLVLVIARADEEVDGRVDTLDQVTELRGVLVDQRLGSHVEPLRGLRNRLTVLVGTGEKEDVLTALAHVPGEHVGSDRRVRMAEVRLSVDVVDRRGEE